MEVMYKLLHRIDDVVTKGRHIRLLWSIGRVKLHCFNLLLLSVYKVVVALLLVVMDYQTHINNNNNNNNSCIDVATNAQNEHPYKMQCIDHCTNKSNLLFYHHYLVYSFMSS